MSENEKSGRGLDIGGLFNGIGNFLKFLSNMEKEGKNEAGGSGEFEALGGKARGIYGFSVRTGLGNKPVVENFGNIRERDGKVVVTETREPLVDVLDEGNTLVIIVEIPGVEEKDSELKVNGDILEISASAKDRKYKKELLLPYPVAAESLKSFFRNGIMEIRLSKQ